MTESTMHVQKLTIAEVAAWSRVTDEIFVSDIIDLAAAPVAKMTVGFARVGSGQVMTSSFPYDEVLILTKGAGYTVDTEHGESLTVGAGEVIYLPAGSRNTFTAEADVEMVYVANPAAVYADHVAASTAAE